MASVSGLASLLVACGGEGSGSGSATTSVAPAQGTASAVATAPSTERPVLSRFASGPKQVVFYNPYAGVDFQGSARLLAQHHDHSGVTQARILSYDTAGYSAIGLQDYSGNPRLPYAWTSRRWPPDQWLPKSFMSRLKNIEYFLPNAEEVGIPEFHVTSTFVDQYIESVPDPASGQRERFQYKTGAEMLELINGNGGVACVAHPFEAIVDSNYYAKFPCMEVYSAYAEGMREQGNAYFTSKDRNRTMLENWDRVLKDNSRVLGIAVNDHFGPDTPPFQKVPPSIKDSGKIQVLLEKVSLEDYEAAFRRGAFFAIVDRGEVKGDFPYVRDILVFPNSIVIDTDDKVRWITNYGVVAEGPELELDALQDKTWYARAEITNANGTVYTQAFSIRARGDLNGDRRVDDDELVQVQTPYPGPGREDAQPVDDNR